MKKLLLLFIVFAIILTQSQFANAAGVTEFTLILPGKEVQVGKPFTLQIYINSGSHSVDTARLQISFSADLLSAINVTLNGQLTSASPGNFVNNTTGVISWGAFTVDNPVVKKGNFGLITFMPKTIGEASIKILGASRLIDNGEEVINPSLLGVFVISSLVIPTKATILIVPAIGTTTGLNLQLKSPTHPDPVKWYRANTAQFKWDKLGTGQYLWGFDQTPDTVPSKPISETTKQVGSIKNGIWYFHLTTVQSAPGKPNIAHFKIQVDSLKPNPIEPYLEISDLDNLILRFATTDYHSGIASYDVQVNQDNFDKATSPFALHGLNLGANFINVTAYDLAGNSRTGWIKFTLSADGTINNLSTSGDGLSLCSIIPSLCAVNWLVVIPSALLLIIILIISLRRRVNVLDTKTIIKTDVGTVAKTVTRTDPKSGKKLITKTVTKTDVKNIVETDIGAVTKQELDKDHEEDDKK